MTESLHEDETSLPANWARIELDSLGEWFGGGTPSKGNPSFWTNGTVPWISPKDMKQLEISSAEDYITEEAVAGSATKIIPEHSVLMVTRSGILRHTFPVAINLVPVSLNQDLKAIRPSNGISAKFLAYNFILNNRQILSLCSKDGTTVQSIEFDRIKKFKVPVAPINEQSRIASKIEELFSDLDKGEESLRQAQVRLRQYRQAVLKAAVTGELTRDWRERRKGQLESGEALLTRILAARREAWEKAELEKMHAKGKPPKDEAWKKKYVEPKGPDTTGLPELPEGWCWVQAELCFSVFTNGTSAKPDEAPTGERVLRISAVRRMQVNHDDIRRISTLDEGSKNAFSVRKGDVLFTRYNGSAELVGVAGVYRGENGVLHPDKLIKARVCDNSVVSSDWLEIAFNTWIPSEFIRNNVKTSAGQHGIAGGSIKICPVPIPPPDEQNAAVEVATKTLSMLFALEIELESKVISTHGLRQSILKSAFSGTLVPQDPNDEPASALLERIAAEKAAQQTAARPGRPRMKKGAVPAASSEPQG